MKPPNEAGRSCSVTVPTYASPDGETHRGWNGWGDPAKLSREQASQHAELCRAGGLCGQVGASYSGGVAVCDKRSGHVGEVHTDFRIGVAWEGRRACVNTGIG